MEIILLIAALVTILWVATGLIGLERVRQWLRLVEKPPYVVAHRYKQSPQEVTPSFWPSAAPWKMCLAICRRRGSEPA